MQMQTTAPRELGLEKKMTTYENLIAQASTQSVKLDGGVYLASQAEMIAEQADWADTDKAKSFDFTAAPFWITTDSGDSPIAVLDADDLESEDVNKCWAGDVNATTYYMTAKNQNETGTWEQCEATTLAAAKREATAQYGAGWVDSVLMIAEGDNVNTQRHVVASRRNSEKRWS